MTKDLTERLKQRLSEDHLRGCEGRQYDCTCGFDDETDALLTEAASLIQRLEGERDEAIKLMTQYAREAGEAKGRLKMSEAAGIVDGWRERTEAAEQALSASQQEVERLKGLLTESLPRCKEDTPHRCERLGGDKPGDERLCCRARSALQTGGKEHG